MGGVGKQTTGLYFVGTGPTEDDLLPLRQGIGLSLFSGLKSRNGTGRTHWPWTPKSAFDGDMINSTGRSYIQPLKSFLENSFSVGGATFTPCVWSRQLNVFNIITEARPCLQPMWCVKRGPRDVKEHPPFFWPDVW